MTEKKDKRKNLRIDTDLHYDLKLLSAQMGLTIIGLLRKLVDERSIEFEKEKTEKNNNH